MTRLSCLVLAGVLASTACAPAVVPAASPSPRLLLAQATPAPVAPDYGAPPPVEPPQPEPPASKKAETPQEREDRQLGRTWGWTAVSIGTFAGVLAIGTSILMLEDNSTRNSNCNGQKVCNAAGLTANGQLNDLGPWNAGLWVIGVAGLGIGAYLLVTHPTDRAMGTQIGVAPNGSGASFELRSSF
jgi:hypothetical protein